MGIVLVSTAATAVNSEAGTFEKLAGFGAMGTVGLIALVGLGGIALLLMLIGWVGVLADYQGRGSFGRTAAWVAVVLCLPLLGTGLWAVLGRRRRSRGEVTDAASAEAAERVGNAATPLRSDQPLAA